MNNSYQILVVVVEGFKRFANCCLAVCSHCARVVLICCNCVVLVLSVLPLISRSKTSNSSSASLSNSFNGYLFLQRNHLVLYRSLRARWHAHHQLVHHDLHMILNQNDSYFIKNIIFESYKIQFISPKTTNTTAIITKVFKFQFDLYLLQI